MAGHLVLAERHVVAVQLVAATTKGPPAARWYVVAGRNVVAGRHIVARQLVVDGRVVITGQVLVVAAVQWNSKSAALVTAIAC